MSVPPPPNQWGARNRRRAVRPSATQPWAPPQGRPAGWCPAVGSQRGWGAPSGPSPGRGDKGKWIFAGIALLAVIAVTVVITVLVAGKDSAIADSDADGRSHDRLR